MTLAPAFFPSPSPLSPGLPSCFPFSCSFAAVRIGFYQAIERISSPADHALWHILELRVRGCVTDHFVHSTQDGDILPSQPTDFVLSLRVATLIVVCALLYF